MIDTIKKSELCVVHDRYITIYKDIALLLCATNYRNVLKLNRWNGVTYQMSSLQNMFNRVKLQIALNDSPQLPLSALVFSAHIYTAG